jgi:hypothetical protein
MNSLIGSVSDDDDDDDDDDDVVILFERYLYRRHAYWCDTRRKRNLTRIMIISRINSIDSSKKIVINNVLTRVDQI